MQRKTLDQHRRERGIGVLELARRVKVDPAQMSRWLTGTNKPQIRALDKLCEALGISRDDVEV